MLCPPRCATCSGGHKRSPLRQHASSREGASFRRGTDANALPWCQPSWDPAFQPLGRITSRFLKRAKLSRLVPSQCPVNAIFLRPLHLLGFSRLKRSVMEEIESPPRIDISNAPRNLQGSPKGRYHKLRVCVPLQTRRWSRPPEGISRRGCREVTRSRGWSPVNGMSAPGRRGQGASGPSCCHEWTQPREDACNLEQGLHWNPPCWHPPLRRPVCRAVRETGVRTPPSRGQSVMRPSRLRPTEGPELLT